ncbi:MAG TPA: hypothetical protein VMK12_12035 [Anaeromyxobacteraceae bacterium]|nr:hypothetical protein [Anaeromyxobacteraceae bacterium]
MTLDLTCQACDTSFELEVAEILDEPRIRCPNCDARAPLSLTEGFSNALDDLLGHVARLRHKFQLVFELESDDLPAPYDRDHARAVADDDEHASEDLEEEEVDEHFDEDEEYRRDAEE